MKLMSGSLNDVFPGSSVKDEDWGPGGLNQKQGQRKDAKP